MSFLSNMRLSTRISLQQTVLIVALIGTSAFALYSVGNMENNIRVIRDDQIPLLDRMVETRFENLLQRYQAQQILFAGQQMHAEDRDLQEAGERFRDAVNQFREHGRNMDSHMEYVEQRIEEQLRDLQDQAALGQLDSTRLLMNEILTAHGSFTENVMEMQNLLEAGNVEHALRLADETAALHAELYRLFPDFIEHARDLIEIPMSDAVVSAEKLTAVLLIITILVVAIGIGMAVFSASTLRSLRNAMSNISNSIQQVATASSQSSTAITQVSDGSKQQSEATSQAVTAVNQSFSVLSDVSKNTESARELSQNGAETVRQSKAHMDAMMNVVNRISDNSLRINKITEVINNIANQTNMLSLNAAIEAARAGEHGKGFAVVAEQVRKLAESSKSSVDDISQLVQQATSDAEEAVATADSVNREMSKVEESAGETESMMQNIATSMEEQVSTTEELQHNMDTLKTIGEDNANASEEITQSIMELYRVADETNTEVNRFNI